MNIWEPAQECMSRDELEQLQLERLQATINRVFKNVTFYRREFSRLGIIPEDVESLAHLKRLPFTTTEDLDKNYPYGMFAVPLREVVRIHSSSGRGGKPVVVGYTKNDIRVWSGLVARFMTAAGVTRDDVVQIAFRYGLFTGAFGLHYGAEAIGASVIPISTGNTEKQIMIMQDYKTTALVCTPGYALTLAERMEKTGIDARGLSLRVGLFGGEPWSETMRRDIENRLSITATDNYGLSEVIGPGVAGECVHKCGMHIAEDAFIPEIIDPLTGETLPPGQTGELVLTTLTKQAFPMIRFRTRDITSIDYGRCECGRTFVRMKKPSGRSDDVLIVKGVNVSPAQIREVLFAAAQGEPRYQIIADRMDSKDALEVRIEVTEKIFSAELQNQRSFLEMVRKRIEASIGIHVTVKLVEPGSIPEGEGTIIDKRII
ncbi:MAG: phenylacetate--CoA ligase [Syntrophales bacterium]